MDADRFAAAANSSHGEKTGPPGGCFSSPEPWKNRWIGSSQEGTRALVGMGRSGGWRRGCGRRCHRSFYARHRSSRLQRRLVAQHSWHLLRCRPDPRAWREALTKGSHGDARLVRAPHVCERAQCVCHARPLPHSQLAESHARESKAVHYQVRFGRLAQPPRGRAYIASPPTPGVDPPPWYT